MNDKKFYPTMLELKPYSKNLYHVPFPKRLKEQFLDLEAASNYKFNKSFYSLPFTTLNKLIERTLGMTGMTTVTLTSIDDHWLTFIEMIDSKKLAKIIKLWIAAFYIDNTELKDKRKENNEIVKEKAELLIQSITDEDFICNLDAKPTVLVNNNCEVQNEGYSVLPLIIVNYLEGKKLSLNNTAYDLCSAGIHELFTKPTEIMVGKETQKISLGIYVSVQTIPSSQKGYLNIELSLKRWIFELKNNQKVFIPNDKISYLGINEHHYQKIIGRYDSLDKKMAWTKTDCQWFNSLYPGATLPDMDEVIKNPGNYQNGQSDIYIPFDTQMSGYKKVVKAGLASLDWEQAFNSLRGLLSDYCDPQITGSKDLNIKLNHISLDDYFDADFKVKENSGFINNLSKAIDNKKLTIEIWYKKGGNKDHEQCANLIYNKLQEHFKGTIEIVRCDISDYDKIFENKPSEEFFNRVNSIKDNVKPVEENNCCLAFVILEGKDFYDQQRRTLHIKYYGNGILKSTDPKNAIRLGLALTGRLSQFITPDQLLKGEERAESSKDNQDYETDKYEQEIEKFKNGLRDTKPQRKSNNQINVVLQNALIDGYRQLGLLPNIKSGNRLNNHLFMGIETMGYLSLVGGKYMNPFPIVSIVDLSDQKEKVYAYCDLFCTQELPYNEFLIAAAKYSAEVIRDRQRVNYSVGKLSEFINSYLLTHSVTLMVENNALNQKVIKGISNKSILNNDMPSGSTPLVLNNLNKGVNIPNSVTGMEAIIRVRSAYNHQVPGYYTEKNDKINYPRISGLFEWHGTYYSLAAAPHQDSYAYNSSLSALDDNKFFSRRKLLEEYPVYVKDTNKTIDYLAFVHNLRDLAIQSIYVQTIMPLPLELIEADKIREYMISD